MNQINLYDLTRSQLTETLAEWDLSSHYAELVWDYLYRRRLAYFRDFEAMPPNHRSLLEAYAALDLPRIIAVQASKDGTRKMLLELADGQLIETVLMPYRDRFTACISTQAGCAMGCVFCATGQMGFFRHLTAGEIVGQVLHAVKLGERLPTRHKLRNVVFMGMGEPLHNYERTMDAVRILTDDRGLAIGPRHVTISTVGLPDQIRRLASEPIPVNLAVSLHGATDRTRTALIPVARRWDLESLIAACRDYTETAGRRIFFEWTLIAGENDRPEQAHALAKLLGDMDAHINLIRLNPTTDFDGEASRDDDVDRFKRILADYGLPSTVRQHRGIDIDAGCGQLRERIVSRDNLGSSS